MRVGAKLLAQLKDAGNGELKERAGQAISGLFKVATGIISQGSTDGQDLIDAISGNSAEDSIGKMSADFLALVKERTAGGDDKVIFFVDEIDKLAPAKGVELLETLKNSFECKGCVFVTAIDYSFLMRGAQDRYGRFSDENQEKSFFNKLFQISFRVLASGYHIQEYVKEELENIGVYADDKEELDFYVELIRRSLGGEAKGAERLFASFSLLKNMADEEMYEDRYKRLVLFALLCMQARFREVYDFAVRMQDSVTPKFLSGICCGLPEEMEHLKLSEQERELLADFAKVFYDIINTDKKEGISETECKAFREVLHFSSITA